MTSRVLLVYNADGGVLGEAMYFLKKGLGVAKCDLCTLTHSGIRERDAWKRCREGLSAEVVGLHRNELSAREVDVIAGRYPCVLIERGGELEFALGPNEFEAFKGSPERLAHAIASHLEG